MTPEEYRAALNSLSSDQFRKFRAAWGGASETVDQTVQEYVYAKERSQWEQIAIFRLREARRRRPTNRGRQDPGDRAGVGNRGGSIGKSSGGFGHVGGGLCPAFASLRGCRSRCHGRHRSPRARMLTEL